MEGRTGCPYCEHVNSPKGREKNKKPENPVFKPNRDENRTMIGFINADQKDEITEVKRLTRSAKCKTPPGNSFFLLMVEDTGGKKEFPLAKDKTTIGRKGCDIILKDPGVSRKHCVIEYYGEKIILKDLESANGTLINQKIIKEDFLNDQDEIQVGETRFKFIRRG